MNFAVLASFIAAVAAVAYGESSCPDDDYCLLNKLPDGAYPNPESPSHYISCTDSLTSCMPCPRGFIWNEYVRRCAAPQSHVESEAEDHCPKDFCENRTDGLYGNPAKYDQHYFIKCWRKNTYCFHCPAGLIWNNKRHRCDYKPSFTSSNKTHCPKKFCKGKKDGDYANPAKMDQHYFIKCTGGITYCFHCPAGLVWNKKLKRCDYPSKVHADAKSHCAKKYCKNKKDGDYANPAKMDQHYFIKCSNHRTFCFHCPDDLIWNDKLKRCDHPKGTEYAYIKF